jgi:hypothetical protein
MNRLADKIFACFPPPGPDRPSWGPAGAAAPADGRTAAIPVLLADDAAERLFAGSPREYWDFRRDFPDCTPPFPRFVVEMARPSRIYSSTMGLNAPDGLPDRWAWYLEAWGRAELAALPADRARPAADNDHPGPRGQPGPDVDPPGRPGPGDGGGTGGDAPGPADRPARLVEAEDDGVFVDAIFQDHDEQFAELVSRIAAVLEDGRLEGGRRQALLERIAASGDVLVDLADAVETDFGRGAR